MRKFEIKYNDGVYAATITFNDNHSEDFIKKYLEQEIELFNTNPNKDYHISRKNITEITK